MKKFGIIMILPMIIVAGCIFSDNNKNRNSQPGFDSISLSVGARITTKDLTISWKGNSPALEYRCELDGSISQWSDSTSIPYYDLTEGLHLFTVTARRDTVTGTPVSRQFTVDILDEPSVIFSRRRLSGIGGVTISIDGAHSLMAAHIEIVCDNSSARIFEFTPAASPGRPRVVMSDLSNPSRLVLDIGFPEPYSENPMVIGSMLVQPIMAEGRISVDDNATIFRNFQNEQIVINGFDEILLGN